MVCGRQSSPTRCRWKKDCQALLEIFGALSEDIVAQVDISKTAKEIWEFLKTRHMGAARVIEARVQDLRREFETMFMGEEESVANFAGKLSKVATQLRSLVEKIDDGVLVAKLLRAASKNFDAFSSYIEQFRDMDSMSLEEAIGLLKISYSYLIHYLDTTYLRLLLAH